MTVKMKTAVASSPSMCETAYCEKAAVKLLLVQWVRYLPDVGESVHCFEHAEEIQGAFEHDQFVGEYL